MEQANLLTLTSMNIENSETHEEIFDVCSLKFFVAEPLCSRSGYTENVNIVEVWYGPSHKMTHFNQYWYSKNNRIATVFSDSPLL